MLMKGSTEDKNHNPYIFFSCYNSFSFFASLIPDD